MIMKKAVEEEMSTCINQLSGEFGKCGNSEITAESLMIDITEKHHQKQKTNGRQINVISILSSQMKSLKKYLLMN